jgi:hypothetical protein
MFPSCKGRTRTLLRILERICAPHLALVCILSTALISISCGTATQGLDSQAAQTLHLSATLPTGTADQAYNAVISVSGGSAPYYFSIASGSVPDGLKLNPRTGSISGVPTVVGTYSFEIFAFDASLRNRGRRAFSIPVGPRKAPSVNVAISPLTATVVSAQKQQFTATVSGTSNTAVTWTASLGSIDANGLYTAPSVSAQKSAVVTAISKADSSHRADATLTLTAITAPQPPAITTSSLPQGEQGSLYTAAVAATGGARPYSWKIASGNLPAGLNFTSAGQFSGSPSAAGTYSFAVSVTDANALSTQKNFTVTVNSGTNYDGPAELPRVTVSSSMASTPAPGSTITVNAGDDLQAALNSASCGDTIQLQAGATFHGKFVFPAKPCDDSHWIIVRTSTPDSALPAEGQRMTPCYAGVASLPGRPAYPCPNPRNLLARLLLDVNGDGAIRLADGANHYRVLGLEITRPEGMPSGARLIIPLGVGDHIVIDRSWLHGTKQDETHAGFNMNGLRYAAVVDSYFNDFKCVSVTGACTDAHAISGGVSDTQDGPYLIQNNFLEASGESVMFGGGPATATPTDIEILHNHFFKPWQWMQGKPNFIGGTSGNPFIVKNHLELKNAVRVLVDGNLMENNWGGFSQTGYGIVLSPKNQHVSSTNTNVCPICQVTDVTIRYSLVIHAGGGVQLATALSGDGTNGAPARAGARWSLHDLILDDLSPNYVGGGTAFLIMNAWATNPLNTLTINHVTAFPDSTSHMAVIGNQLTNAPMYGLVFTNNIIMTGAHPIWSSGGGSGNCAYYDVPITTINACFKTSTFRNNALVATPSAFPPSSWPSGNFFPASADAVGFADFNGGNGGGDYTLLSTSPFKNKATDGADLGANIAAVTSALSGVE